MSITDRHPVLLHPDQGKVVRARGDLYLFKALAAQTEGHYSLFEARHFAGGCEPGRGQARLRLRTISR